MAGLAILRYAFRSGEDPSGDGPSVLIVEFLGFWAAAFLLGWSFTVTPGPVLWTLRIAAAVAALIGIALSVYFAATAEDPETPEKEPTGFKNDSTDLHLE